MPDTPSESRTWVFHAGALGDFVMTWPLLRAMTRSGAPVTVAAPASKANLAAAELSGVTALDIEQPRFVRLWRGAEAMPAGDAIERAERVYTFIADDATPGGRAWLAGAASLFPGAEVIPVGIPGSPSRAAAWAHERIAELGLAPARENPAGPVVVHIGAGSRRKRWPVERWAELVRWLHLDRGQRAQVLYGEVEAEQFSDRERASVAEMQGRLCTDIQDLADRIRAARLFVGADTGPTHLAAQLGVPTLALFGPTDPGIWAPIGPRVRVLAPGAPTAAMDWLDADTARRALSELAPLPAPAGPAT